MSNLQKEEILLLFDVDGTLTNPRSIIEADFKSFLCEKIKPRATIAIVGGSDLGKMYEQLNGKEILENFNFIFPENGMITIDNGKEVAKQSIQKHLGEEVIQEFINFCLHYLSELKLPCKRGTFIDFRTGMLNISPIGRQCSREERNAFEEYDNEHGVRGKMIEVLKKKFHNVDLTYSIGGQISFDVFPHGWDKTYCLKHLTENYSFKEIHFFGDKTHLGGNDYEIFEDPRTIGHKVKSPQDTKVILKEMFGL